MSAKYRIRLNEEERTTLLQIISKGKAAASKVRHANILLMSDLNHGKYKNKEIAKTFQVHENTVQNIKKRYVEEGLESALNPKKRSEQPNRRILDGAKEARLIAICCGEPPKKNARWTLRLLADRLVELEICETISYETVRRTLKKTN